MRPQSRLEIRIILSHIRMKHIILIFALFMGCSSKDDPVVTPTPTPSAAIKDKDGNTYTTITAGTQVWLKQNLKTRHFNNGDAISDFEGVYYSWAEVKDSRGICPSGYRVATDAEWSTMVDFYGGVTAISPIIMGFQPAAAGYFNNGAGVLFSDGWGYYWTATANDASSAYSWQFKSGEDVVRSSYGKDDGLCVRCIKN